MAPTDAVIDELTPLLEQGDMVIDGGNAHYDRHPPPRGGLRDHGLHFVGDGHLRRRGGRAQRAASIMPGGSEESYEHLGPVLESIAAKVDGSPAACTSGPTAPATS